MNENERLQIYADGGLAREMPSRIGGAAAWRAVRAGDGHDEDEVLSEGAETITPEDLLVEKVTNAHVELLAVVRGVLSVLAALACVPPDRRPGKILVASDSQYALNVFQGIWSARSVPTPLLPALEEARRAVAACPVPVEYELLAGHPTPKDRAQGFQTKPSGNTYRVSVHNEACDKAARRACDALVARRGTNPPPPAPVAERARVSGPPEKIRDLFSGSDAPEVY